MRQPMIDTYEEAIEAVRACGILPLAPLIPDHPSLSGITLPERWHSDTELDPWRWRVRFPGDGIAAYGKFMKKKAILVASDLVPSVRSLLGSSRSIAQRYGDGLISKAAKEVYAIIEEEQGIETRALRASAGMKAKESKKEFDQALAELQSGFDIVISGVRAPRNEAGEVNGWNSTCFETVEHWMEGAGIPLAPMSAHEARSRLQARLGEHSSPQAMAYFAKVFGF
ncbi:hypothetical protein J27TS7_23460 [Paenibacillus dendritiformis]|uniref:AlkZ-related protein n=1 Tax=Paenibacillus dendritiformis TaxID=130049 RepID=UPI001B2E9AA9|nr:hypothetical protein [Paenibacillus dendritiformis]GIO72832.1 hypothetical protein J27TS7_23460 [Paenibacillus dendritiformis]